jgi:hypothetical protein
MKKIIFISALVLSGILIQAQTDIEIANSLIGRPYSDIKRILDEHNLVYYITADDEYSAVIYIENNNSIKLWEIKHSNLYREITVNGKKILNLAGNDLVLEIFVRYRHSNLNDLREFHSYEVPENTEHRTYEKSYGSKISHLRVTQT